MRTKGATWWAAVAVCIGLAGTAGAAGVPVGSSSLLSGLDYSDSFTLTASGGNPGRVANVYPVNLPGINVEDNHGNPAQAWTDAKWSVSSDAAVIPGGTSYPGGSGAGSATGMTQRGDSAEDWGIEYSLRNDFVVQTDFVQTTDRVDITVGAARDNIFDPGNLSVFFRRTGHPSYPEVGLYNPTIGERNTRLTTEIAADGQWHNYAVRFNLPENELLIFVDEKYRGAVNLNTFEGGVFAGLGISPAAVSVGYAGGDRGWSDNFQVGSATAAASAPRMPGFEDDYRDTFTLGQNGRANGTYNTGSPAYDVEYAAGGNPLVTWTPASNFSFNDPPGSTNPGLLGAAGGNPGAATGLAQSGGGDFSIAYGLRTIYAVSVDAILPLDRLDISSFANPGDSIFAGNNLSVFFRRDSSTLGAIGLYDGSVETWVLPPGGLGISDQDWHNFAVWFDQDNDRVQMYVDQVLMADLDLLTFAGGLYADYSNGAVGVGGAGYDWGYPGGPYVLWVDNFRVGYIPEPITAAILAMAAGALGGYVRRRRKA